MNELSRATVARETIRPSRATQDTTVVRHSLSWDRVPVGAFVLHTCKGVTCVHRDLVTVNHEFKNLGQ